MVELAEQNGTRYFDRWEMMGSYTGCMCGSPQSSVINDAYQKGIRDYDLAKAYEYSVNTCEKFGNGPQGYASKGHGLAITLENAYADWNLAQLAAGLGHADDAKTMRPAAWPTVASLIRLLPGPMTRRARMSARNGKAGFAARTKTANGSRGRD